MSRIVFLVLGLGNPGPEYELTRHNAGFLALDTLSEKHGIPLDDHRFHALFGSGRVGECEAVLAKPLTYMNESGVAARALLKALELPPERLIVLHDDIDLQLGRIKCKFGGGNAGQKGIGSIIARLGTDKFHRVRLGIGRPESREEIVDYVLSPFTDEEVPEVNQVLEDAARRIEKTLIELNSPSQSQATEEHTE
ncbi:MAG: aminoacyl-tRNA hydrolase [Nitrospinaceae bacterium]